MSASNSTVKEKSEYVSQVSFYWTKECKMTHIFEGKSIIYCTFLLLPEDPDPGPGSGSDCLPADEFIMTGTGGLLHPMISDWS